VQVAVAAAGAAADLEDPLGPHREGIGSTLELGSSSESRLLPGDETPP